MEERYTAAIEAVEEMLVRSRDTRGKFAPGTAQHTLQKNRAAALEFNNLSTLVIIVL